MKYWLGIAYIKPYKNKIIISSDVFSIIVNLEENEKFLYNKIDEKKFKCVDIKFKKIDDKQIMGFATFISNISLLFKKYIRNKKIRNDNLNNFYENIFKVIKSFLE
jgi:hypothetical protein